MANIQTTSGDVEIKEISGAVSIETESGKVKLTQNGQNLTKITTKSGEIVANFTKIGNVQLNTQKGTININVATSIPFVFEYKTKASVKISWITTKIENQGKMFVACEEEVANKIAANSEKGNIKLADGFAN